MSNLRGYVHVCILVRTHVQMHAHILSLDVSLHGWGAWICGSELGGEQGARER